MALAYALGQASLSDAYNLANNSPNAVYELILGGVLSATLVPVFTAQLEDHDDEATDAVLTVSAIALAVITTVAVLAAPLIVRVLTLHPDPSVDVAALRDVGTSLARLLLPQIFFYGLMALGSALLNARGRFFAPAWAPVLNNLVVIAVFFAVGVKLSGEPSLSDAQKLGWLVPVLGIGSTLGIAVMALALVPALIRAKRADPLPAGVAPPGRAQGAGPVGVDHRLRGGQPGGAARRSTTWPGPATATCPPTSSPSCSSSSPTVSSPCRSPPRSPRSSPGSGTGATAGPSTTGSPSACACSACW